MACDRLHIVNFWHTHLSHPRKTGYMLLQADTKWCSPNTFWRCLTECSESIL